MGISEGYKKITDGIRKSPKKGRSLFSLLVVSIIMTVMSLAGLTAATYAWFTGVAVADGSSIDAGILDAGLYRYIGEFTGEGEEREIDVSGLEDLGDPYDDNDNWEEVTDETVIFSGTLTPGGDITEYFAVTNEGDVFSEYGLTFTVEKINDSDADEDEEGGADDETDSSETEPLDSGEGDLSEVIQVFFANVDKESGKPGPYIYIGNLSELDEAAEDVTEEEDPELSEYIPSAEELDEDSSKTEEHIHTLLDKKNNNFIRGLLLTKEEAEGHGYAGQHTYVYDPDEDDEGYPYSIERIRQHLMGNDIDEEDGISGETGGSDGDSGEEEMPGDYRQLISIRLRLPNKLYAEYQNCNIKIAAKQVATQRAREISTITAYGKPDDEGKLIGFVAGGGTYHKSIRSADVPEADFEPEKVTLTPIPETGYKFSRWTYGLTAEGEENMEESQEEELEITLDDDWTCIAEFVKDSEYEEIDVPGDDDWGDDDDEHIEEGDITDPFG